VTFSGIEFDRSIITAASADGFKMSNTGSNNAANIVIQNCYTHNFPQNGVLISPGPPNANHITVNNCEIAWNGSPDAHVSFGHGLYCELSDNTFTNNHVHDNREYGIHCYSGSAVAGDTTFVSRNLISGNRSHDNGRGWLGGSPPRSASSRKNSESQGTIKPLAAAPTGASSQIVPKLGA
jgi:hypothetical protein